MVRISSLIVALVLAGMPVAAQVPRGGGGGGEGGPPPDLSGLVQKSCAVSRSDSTTLSIGACSVRIGNANYSITPATVVISAGTGTAFVYVDQAGAMILGHNGLTVDSCTGCTAAGSITAFPAASIPVYTWPVTSGTWDTSGAVDKRTYVHRDLVVAGTGITGSVSAGVTTLAIDEAVVPNSPNIDAQIQVFPPATAHSTGDGKAYFFIPARLNSKVLTAVSAQTITAGTVSGTLTVQLARCAAVTTGNVCSGTVVDILSTRVTVDAGEDSSDTAATAAVIDTAADDVSTNQVIRIDVDVVHGTPGAGLILNLTFSPV